MADHNGSGLTATPRNVTCGKNLSLSINIFRKNMEFDRIQCRITVGILFFLVLVLIVDLGLGCLGSVFLHRRLVSLRNL